MNVCTILTSGRLDVDTFLFLVGMGVTAVALSFRPAKRPDVTEEATAA
jgi:hypothetical protein